jgi:hypothetical protein
MTVPRRRSGFPNGRRKRVSASCTSMACRASSTTPRSWHLASRCLTTTTSATSTCHSEGGVRPHRPDTARPLRGRTHSAPQPGDESGAVWRVAGGDQRPASASLPCLDHDLRQAGYRRSAIDRSTLARRGRSAMSTWATNLDRYLTIRRSLGYTSARPHGSCADSSPSRKGSTPSP